MTDPHADNLRQAFAAQFEPNPAGYLYRHGRKGPPVQVSVAERDAFVARFDRQVRWAQRVLFAGGLVVAGLFMMLSTGSGIDWRWLYAAAGGTGLSTLAFYFRARGAPARALARRPVVGNERRAGDLRRRSLQALGWQTIATGIAAAVALIVVAWIDGDPRAGWHPFGIAAGLALLALLVVQGIHKWRLGGGA